MTEQRNIVLLGASFAGLQATHYILKHIIPALNARDAATYKLQIINPSSEFYFRIGSPRTATSTARLPLDKVFYSITDGLKQYPANDYNFIEGLATSLDTATRSVAFKRHGSATEESLPYHALIIATGSRTHHPAFSMHQSKEAIEDAIKTMNTQVSTSKDIVIVGGGPTGVETAGEIGEHLNGKPGWFSKVSPKANITLITSDSHLLPSVRASVGADAEKKLKALGVSVVYNTRVVNATPNGKKTSLTLSKGDKLEVDLYIPAHGVLPNSEWIPKNLLNERGYVKTDPTLRVEGAGPRVYGLGDVASYSRNSMIDVNDSLPVLYTNLRRDLFAYNPAKPAEKAPGQDRVFKPNLKDMLGCPIGSTGGVAIAFGWRLPSFVIWLVKARDMMTGMVPPQLMGGDSQKKEIKWTKEEEVV